jgi:hypothetical protein
MRSHRTASLRRPAGRRDERQEPRKQSTSAESGDGGQCDPGPHAQRSPTPSGSTKKIPRRRRATSHLGPRGHQRQSAYSPARTPLAPPLDQIVAVCKSVIVCRQRSVTARRRAAYSSVKKFALPWEGAARGPHRARRERRGDSLTHSAVCAPLRVECASVCLCATDTHRPCSKPAYQLPWTHTRLFVKATTHPPST